VKKLGWTLILLVLMAGFGFAVNRWIAAHKTNLNAPAVAPEKAETLVNVPGTIYLTQTGVLYALTNGHFRAVKLPPTDAAGGGATWGQPAVLPDGNLAVVLRGSEYSDLFEVSPQGGVLAQLTKDYVSADPNKIRGNHWIAWPRVAPDGKSLFFSLDSPKPNSSYEVDFSVWSTPIGTNPIVKSSAYYANGTVTGTRWTTPDQYTGGDTAPNPLPDGGLLYVGYAVGGDLKVGSTLIYQATSKTHSIPLTTPGKDCNAASVAPDGVTVAMICSDNSQQTSLETATLTVTPATRSTAAKATLSSPKVLVQNCLCASPQWSQDGKSLIYLAPADKTGHFQLWLIEKATITRPTAPKQVTESLDFDATSVPAWASGGTAVGKPFPTSG
jgi:Tol biopolymer transport system component